jgi:flagellar protein FlaI
MESVLINVDREKEALVPRPTPDAAGEAEAAEILESAEDLFETYRGQVPDSVADALLEMNPAGDVEAAPVSDHETLAETAREADAAYDDPAGPEPATGATGAADSTEPDEADAAPSDAEGAGPSGTHSPDPAHGDFEGVSEAAGDGSGDPDGIDFGEPFDEGVDVLSSPAGPSERGAPPDPGRSPDSGTSPDVSEGFSAADPVESERSGEADGGETAGTDGETAGDEPGPKRDDGEASDADEWDAEAGTDAADATKADESDDEPADDGSADDGSADDGSADDGSADDIDEWGFDAVEPAEDG